MIKRALKIQSGSSTPQAKNGGNITAQQVREIAEIKMPDLNARDIEAAIKMVEGTAHSMGIVVEQAS